MTKGIIGKKAKRIFMKKLNKKSLKNENNKKYCIYIEFTILEKFYNTYF